MVEMSSNVIYVGRKPLESYCGAIIKTLNDYKTVKLLARGNAISRAVDAVEITRNRYLDGVEVKSIEISTDTLASSFGDVRNVTIVLKMKE